MLEEEEYICREDGIFYMAAGNSARCTSDFIITDINNITTKITCTSQNAFVIPFLNASLAPYKINNEFILYPAINEHNLTCPNYRSDQKVIEIDDKPDKLLLPLALSLSAFGLICLCFVLYQFHLLKRRKERGKYVKRPKTSKLSTLFRSRTSGGQPKDNFNGAKSIEENNAKGKSTTVLINSTPQRGIGGSSSWQPGNLGEKARVIAMHKPENDDELFISPGDVVIIEQFYEDGWVKVRRIETSPTTFAYVNKASPYNNDNTQPQAGGVCFIEDATQNNSETTKFSIGIFAGRGGTTRASSQTNSGLVPYHNLTKYISGMVTIIQKTTGRMEAKV